MKKISLKTFWKSFNLNKIQQPSLANTASCDINREDEKGKVGTPSGSSADKDTFSSSAPIIFKDMRAHRPIRPSASTAITSRPLFQPESTPECQFNEKLGFSEQDLYLPLDEHVPVVTGLLPQDYVQYTMPLDEGMCPLEGSRSYSLDSSSAVEVSVVPPQVEGRSFPEDESQVDQDLVVAPEIFVDQSINGLLTGTTGVMLQSPRVGHDDVPPFSPLLPPMQNNQIQRNFSGLTGTEAHVAESMLCHLNFDLNSAPGVARVYVSVESSGPMVVTSLTEELKKLAKQGWYWGPITCWEAEGKLASVPNECYLLSLSFRSHGKTLHTRIEHSNGRFSFYEQPDVEGHTSIDDLIEHSIKDSENGAFCYSRSQLPGSATYLVRLAKSVSWFMQVHLLQYLCRFVTCQYTRIDLNQKLPLPNKMKDYLQEKHY
uniref:Suppressor of cytokine signaling 6 n=1 Tax=Rhinopithecus bieti TaxID=61621 RepID=A0A2K6LDZ5_RHIBE